MTASEEERIRKAFSDKDWQEIKAQDTWQIFKIMSEFVEGFEKMSRIGPCVSIFGSARTKPDTRYFLLAEEIAYQHSQAMVLSPEVVLVLWRPVTKVHSVPVENL